ncbi:MAG: hypothetical protein HGA76_10335, partial [Candidatus Firestonebacteria bacterium]|nr:hypothetical protein [Candidatus Firestonebacteria bacterium]
MVVAGRRRVQARNARTSASALVWREMQRAFQAINQEKEFSAMVSTALRQACRLFRSEGALLLLANRGTGLLEIGAVENISAEALEVYRRAPARTDALGPDLDPAAAAADRERIRGLAKGFARHLLLPIALQDKIIGALMLTDVRAGGEFQESPE